MKKNIICKSIKSGSILKWTSLAFVFAALSSCVQPGSMMQVNNKLDVLEKRILVLEQEDLAATTELRRESKEFNQSITLQITDLQETLKAFVETLDQIKEEIKSGSSNQTLINEKLEINGNKIDELQKRLGDQLIELDKIKDFFKASIETNSDSTEGLPEMLAKAMEQFREKRFEESAKVLISFREKYPQSKYVDDALYFIAYGDFLRGELENASLYFFELIRQFPESNRITEAKWWLAAILEQTGDRKGSIDLYSKLAGENSSGKYQTRALSRLEELNNMYAHKINKHNTGLIE